MGYPVRFAPSFSPQGQQSPFAQAPQVQAPPQYAPQTFGQQLPGPVTPQAGGPQPWQDSYSLPGGLGFAMNNGQALPGPVTPQAGGPMPWQNSYYLPGGIGYAMNNQGGAGGQDPNLATAVALTQKYFTPPPATPGYSRYGDQVQSGGYTLTDDLSGDATYAGMSNSDYLGMLLQQHKAMQDPWSMDSAMQQAMQDPRLRNYDGAQRAQILAQASGNTADALRIQQEQQALMNARLTGQNLGLTGARSAQEISQSDQTFPYKLRQEQQALGTSQLANTTSQLSQIDTVAQKLLGANNAAEFQQTYNVDPKHPDQFFRAGGFKVDPNNPTGPAIAIPGEWKGADPKDADYLNSLRSSVGMADQTTAQQNAALDAAKAQRLIDLTTKKNGPLVQTPAMAYLDPQPSAAAPAMVNRFVPPVDPFAAERALQQRVSDYADQQRQQNMFLQYLQSQRRAPTTVRTY